MKKVTQVLGKFSLALAIAALVLTSYSCQSQSSTEAQSESTETVDAAQMDIHGLAMGGDVAGVKAYIKAGGDLNIKEPFGGSSPLISAVVFDQAATAALLIEAGADLDFRNNDGSTALLSAAFFGRDNLVKLLLEKGADKTIKNKFQATAYLTVAGPFEEMKPSYDAIRGMMAPMGLKLDDEVLKVKRPIIAALLKD